MVSNLKTSEDDRHDGEVKSEEISKNTTTTELSDSRKPFGNRMVSMGISHKWSSALKHVAGDTNSFLQTARQVDANNANIASGKKKIWFKNHKKADLTLNCSVSTDDSDSGDSCPKEDLEADHTTSIDSPFWRQLALDQKERMELRELRKKCKRYEKLNQGLLDDVSELETKMKAEQEFHEKEMKEMKTEIENSTLKLSLLEEQFQSLNQAQEEKRDLDGVEQLRGSIVQLDASYLNELKTSLAAKTGKLEQLEQDYEVLKKTSEANETDFKLDVEDMNCKLEARETTILSLEKSLEKMRESLFRPKSPSFVQQKDTDEMSKLLKSKDELIGKLKFKLAKKKSLLKKYREEYDASKSLMLVNETISTTTERLESMSNMLHDISLSQKQEKDNNEEDSKTECAASVLSVVTKVNLLQEELRISIETHELAMKNKLQGIDSELKSNGQVRNESDEKPCEEPERFDIVKISERIKCVQDDSLKALRETEADFSERINDLKQFVRSRENDVSEKNM